MDGSKLQFIICLIIIYYLSYKIMSLEDFTFLDKLGEYPSRKADPYLHPHLTSFSSLLNLFFFPFQVRAPTAKCTKCSG